VHGGEGEKKEGMNGRGREEWGGRGVEGTPMCIFKFSLE